MPVRCGRLKAWTGKGKGRPVAQPVAKASFYTTKRMKGNQLWWLMLLICQMVFLSGCTSVLWDEKTFAHTYEPARPTNLRLFYSTQERELLVQYDEARD